MAARGITKPKYTVGFKLRTLVFLLSLSLLVTAITLSLNYGRRDVLHTQATLLQKALWQKEQQIHSALEDTALVNGFMAGRETAENWQRFKTDFKNNGINLFVYRNGALTFWSTNALDSRDIAALKTGSTLLTTDNGKYLVISQRKGDYLFAFTVLLQSDYALQNDYLESRINTRLLNDDRLAVATLNDKLYEPVRTADGKYAFDVTLKENVKPGMASSAQQWLISLALFFFVLSVTGFCVKLANRGQLPAATLLMAVFLLVLRISDLQYKWFSGAFGNELFDPRKYSQSFWLPSLGALMLNVGAVTWLLVFLNLTRRNIKMPAMVSNNYGLGMALMGVFTAGAYLMGYGSELLTRDLILNSTISFNINVINNITWISWFCIVIVTMLWVNVFLAIRHANYMGWLLEIRIPDRYRILAVVLVLATLFQLWRGFNANYLIFTVYLVFASYVGATHRYKLQISSLIIIFTCMALLTTITFITYTGQKDEQHRAVLLERLADSENPNVSYTISQLEKRLQVDKVITGSPESRNAVGDTALANYVKNTYLANGFAGYEQKVYRVPPETDSTDNNYAVISKYLDYIRNGSVKLPDSRYFYKVNESFGVEDYFGIIPLINNNELAGRLLVVLQGRRFNALNSYPQFLLDRRVGLSAEYDNYALAVYNNGHLANQKGNYTYPLVDEPYRKGPIGDIYKETDTAQRINSLVYRPEDGKTYVISYPWPQLMGRIAVVSFFYIFFVLFTLICWALAWLYVTLGTSRVNWFSLNRVLVINANKLLYKTRIQLTMVLAVVFTLVIVGWTTFYYINNSYREQQRGVLDNAIGQVETGYERILGEADTIVPTEAMGRAVTELANANSVPINVYDNKGNLLYSTLPELFNYGLVARKMSADAFITLKTTKASRFITDNERIGNLEYSAAYTPVQNEAGATIGFINVPYYNVKSDYKNKINAFLNTLVNIYALVFIVIVVLAIFLANQITEPLKFIQQNIKRIALGKKNEQIVYSKHDEIGGLIKEYNNLISALDESARKLARSERESAWRDMAKQVAHEIKNPLTPLKLGVQLLERSWRDKDPNFDEKFDRFNASFIEQIESLARIASEFSLFAKMPDTKLEPVDVIAVTEHVLHTFEYTPGKVNLEMHNNTGKDEVLVMGDRDQVMRIFNNLIKNATEAARPDVPLQVDIIIERGGSYVFIEVRDNGSGISEDNYDRIFTPNFTSKSSGSGLGLAFVRQAVENAGGEVDFKSVPGEGTSFFLKFVSAA